MIAVFRASGLYTKRIIATRDGENVWVSYEGDNVLSLYKPETFGFEKWAALADDQAADNIGTQDSAVLPPSE